MNREEVYGPKADDRTSDDDMAPAHVATVEALLILWAERDERYRASGTRLTAGQLAAIKAYRRRELAEVDLG